MRLPGCETDRDAPITAGERVALGALVVWPMLFVVAFGLLFGGTGCAYKGGKVVDGTNLEIGMHVPGTEWTLTLLSYTGGMRFCGNDATLMVVSNDVCETNNYLYMVTTARHTKMNAIICPKGFWNAEPEPEAEPGGDDPGATPGRKPEDE